VLAQEETDLTHRLEARLTPFLDHLVTLQRVPGLAVGVVEGDRLVYARGFGVRSLAGADPVTPETFFHLASVTKPFVGTALVQLADAGKLDLDAPVTATLPHFAIDDERASAITARQMLAHISGMPDTDDYGWDKPQYDDGALERYVRSLGELRLLSDPGTRYAYSNIAYEVLGDMVAKASGVSFEEYVARDILRPLGMTHSSLLVREIDPAMLADGHVLDERGEIVVSAVFPYNREHAPSSTMYSNVRELACWAAANLAGGELAGSRIVDATSHAAMLQALTVAHSEYHSSVGISWFQWPYRGRRVVAHSGGDTGFSSMFVFVPQAGIAAFAMANTDRGLVPELATDSALEIALAASAER